MRRRNCPWCAKIYDSPMWRRVEHLPEPVIQVIVWVDLYLNFSWRLGKAWHLWQHHPP